MAHEEGLGLAGPDLPTRLVDDVEKYLNAIRGKAPAEISRRGGIGDTARPQGIQQDFVVAEQFQVLQTRAAAQRQIGQRQHMVRFMIGQVDFQQFQALVDGFGEAEPAGESVDQADAATGKATCASRDVVVEVAGGHHGLGAATQVFRVQTALNPALAVIQFSS